MTLAVVLIVAVVVVIAARWVYVYATYRATDDRDHRAIDERRAADTLYTSHGRSIDVSPRQRPKGHG